MHKSQIASRARIAERAAQNPAPPRPVLAPSTDLRARSVACESAVMPFRARKATKLTATQRNSEGRRSEWSASPTYWTDPAWDQTVSTRR